MHNGNNKYMRCSCKSCPNPRYSVSKYCLKCKNYLDQFGSFEQIRITHFRTTLRPYIRKISIEINKNLEKYNNDINQAKRYMNNTDLIGPMYVADELKELLTIKKTNLEKIITRSFIGFNGNEVKLIATVISVFVYQKENPRILCDGETLFFFCGKALFGNCKMKQYHHGVLFYRKQKLSRNQYMLLGMKFYSKFRPIINEFLDKAKDGNPYRKKSKEEIIQELRDERNERIKYWKRQSKKNKDITKEMLNKEIISIKKAFDELIQEEENK